MKKNAKADSTKVVRDAYSQGVLRALSYLQKHLDEPLSLEALATVARFSPFHFHRIFTAFVGEPVKEHIRRLRLERAALKLACGADALVELAFEAGYESQEAFSRAFKERFATSPAAYRKNARSGRGVFVDDFSNTKQHLVEDGDKLPPLEIRIERHPARQVVYARHFGAYTNVGEAWERVCKFAGRRGLFSAETLFIGVSYDSPDITVEERIRYDACVSVGQRVAPEGEIGFMEIPASFRAVARHRGPYESLSKTYRRIFREWLPSSSYTLANRSGYEIYLNPSDKVPPQELRTDICIPVNHTKT